MTPCASAVATASFYFFDHVPAGAYYLLVRIQDTLKHVVPGYSTREYIPTVTRDYNGEYMYDGELIEHYYPGTITYIHADYGYLLRSFEPFTITTGQNAIVPSQWLVPWHATLHGSIFVRTADIAPNRTNSKDGWVKGSLHRSLQLDPLSDYHLGVKQATRTGLVSSPGGPTALRLAKSCWRATADVDVVLA